MNRNVHVQFLGEEGTVMFSFLPDNETSYTAVKANSQWLSYNDLQTLTKGANKDLGLNSASVQMVCREYVTRRKQFKKRKLRWRGKNSRRKQAYCYWSIWS
ncbi:MAG: hypothetical protein HRU09_04965 [Oligoflexales bacterium]|nr:hypothetical protein [Oligoflexales bacterium]